MKKFFIKLAKLFGYEIIDQNKFVSPTSASKSPLSIIIRSEFFEISLALFKPYKFSIFETKIDIKSCSPKGIKIGNSN